MKKTFTYLLAIIGSIEFCCIVPVQAQIVPDATLQNNSHVQINGQTIEITGGTQNDSSLFHSFETFSLPEGNTAYFNNPLDIENIFSRVTGSSVSNIDGTIQANGTANLFLINPNGIVFGSNARLNIGGSFLASTADRLIWPDGISWSATNPNPAPLLTINVPIGLQVGANPGNILVEGEPIAGSISTNIENPEQLEEAIAFQENILENSNGLQVQPGQTLALVGGNITLKSGILKARQGRIELGSLQSAGLVGINFNSLDANGGLVLDYDRENITSFGQIQVLDQAIAIASGQGGGDIQIVGSNLLLTNGSQIVAGTLGNQPGGNVDVRTSNSVELIGNSPGEQNANLLGAGSYSNGDSGNLTIETRRLTIRDGSVVGSGSFAGGNGGEVIIRAADSVDIQGISPNGQDISVVAAISEGTGNAGNVLIETGQLSVRDGAQVAVTTFGVGDAGNITIRATEKVEAIGRSITGEIPSALVAETNGSGDAGNLTIETSQLIVRDGAVVGVGTSADGNGGEAIVRASELVEISGVAPKGQQATFVGAIAQGIGNAGNVTFETGQLTIRDGAQVAVNTLGEGQGGNITIRATEKVEAIGNSPNGQLPSQLAANTGGTGNAGNISIETGQFIVRDGAQVTLETNNQGNAGTLFIRATDRVEAIDAPLLGVEELPPALQELLAIFNQQNQTKLTAIQVPTIRAETLATGNAGNIQIETQQLIVRDGAGIFVGTFSDGQGGNLTVNASESVAVSGTLTNPLSVQGLGAATFAAGDAGNLTIDTAQLIVREGGEVVVGTLQDGNAGTLNITASELVELTGTSPDGQKPSELSAGTRGAGNGGNAIVNTQQLLIDNGATFNVSGQGTGNPGSIDVNANQIFLQDQGNLTATSATGQGGNIHLRAPDIQLRGGSEISASGSETGNITLEGNINLNTEILVLLEGSQIITNAADPRGGSNIAINAIDGSNLVVFQSPDSLINARGELQIDTEVDITQAEILEVEVTDVTQLISRGCEAIAQGSQFTVTGRGGFSSNPGDLLSPVRSMLSWKTRQELIFSEVPWNQDALQLPETGQDLISDRPIEATGWAIAADGTVRLVANAESLDSRNSQLMSDPTCRTINHLIPPISHPRY